MAMLYDLGQSIRNLPVNKIVSIRETRKLQNITIDRDVVQSATKKSSKCGGWLEALFKNKRILKGMSIYLQCSLIFCMKWNKYHLNLFVRLPSYKNTAFPDVLQQ